jgi:hypothetical protein
MMLLILIICIIIIFVYYCKKYDHYQIIDVVRDTCKIECIHRGHSYSECNGPFSNNFTDKCIDYMVKNVIGPLPKNIYMEDIYTEHQPSSDSK